MFTRRSFNKSIFVGAIGSSIIVGRGIVELVAEGKGVIVVLLVAGVVEFFVSVGFGVGVGAGVGVGLGVGVGTGVGAG